MESPSSRKMADHSLLSVLLYHKEHRGPTGRAQDRWFLVMARGSNPAVFIPNMSTQSSKNTIMFWINQSN